MAAEGGAAEWGRGGVFSGGLERSGDRGVWGVWQRCENVARFARVTTNFPLKPLCVRCKMM